MSAPCSSCAALAAELAEFRAEVRTQLDALDRGVVEAGGAAGTALGRLDAQDEAWATFSDASQRARGDMVPAPRRPSRRQRPARPHGDRAALSLVLPGGAA